jgi:hypothetical protein
MNIEVFLDDFNLQIHGTRQAPLDYEKYIQNSNQFNVSLKNYYESLQLYLKIHNNSNTISIRNSFIIFFNIIFTFLFICFLNR